MPQNYLFFTREREYVIKEQESGLMIVPEPFLVEYSSEEQHVLWKIIEIKTTNRRTLIHVIRSQGVTEKEAGR